MSAEYLRAIDWSIPWLAPYQQIGQALLSASSWAEAATRHARGIVNFRGQQIRFVPQSMLPAGIAYESFIAETGMVPTRDNLHDFFNALVWLLFPNTKARLNKRQAEEIQSAGGVRKARGKVRDAATLFDENGALLVVRDQKMLDALRAHQWEEVFLRQRDCFCEGVDVILFGHALMEKLVAPYKAITAHAWPTFTDERCSSLKGPEQMLQLDLRIAGELAAHLDPSAFTPLPVLGVPGWWPLQDHTFYSDRSVFRPKRTKN